MTHRPAIRAVLLGGLLALTAAPLACRADGAAESLVSRYARGVAAVNDYSATIKIHEADGAKVQDRVVRAWFKRPSLLKVEVLAGDGKGGSVLWDGGDTVRGHEGGFLKMIVLTLNIHNPRVTSMRGATIEQGTFPWQVEHLKTIKGRMSAEPGPIIDGDATDVLSVEGIDPALEQGMTKELYFISRSSNLLLRFQGFEGAQLVRESDYSDVKVNIGLTADDFKL
jgi:outer membrane lipoprotein-sorting protein